MSTRNSNSPQSGAEPEDFNLQSCTIEDVDRAVFNLLNASLPFTYKHKEGTKRAPVIFATGERFAVLRRKNPLRDKSGALILPLVSVMRKSITQAPTMGAGTNQTVEHTIKKRLSSEDPLYQRLVNKMNLKNSDNLADASALVKTDGPGLVTGSAEGRIATRSRSASTSLDVRTGKIFSPDLGNNIFEIITMRPPKYYTTSYEVTFWAQYTMQMNDMLMAMMSLYQSYGQRTFKLETDKGYWFVGYVGEDLSSGDNFTDSTDSERLVRYSFDITVPAYLVGDGYPTSRKTITRFVSAPQINFSNDVPGRRSIVNKNRVPLQSADANDHIGENFRTLEEALPGQSVGGAADVTDESTASVATSQTDDGYNQFIEFEINPLTGKKEKTTTVIKTNTNRKGETVLREIDI
jgi:hypothetical protein